MRRQPTTLAFAFLLLAQAALAGGLGVAPPFFELSLNPGEVVEKGVTAFAVGTSFEQVRARVVDWTVGENGAVQVLNPGELPYSAASWIELKTPPFALAEQQRVTVSFAIRVPPNPGDGSFSAGILLEPQAKPPRGAKGKTLRVQGRMLVPVLIRIPGTLAPGYRLVRSRIQGNAFEVTVENTGNTYLSFDGEVRFLSPEGVVVKSGRAPHLFLDRESRVTVRIPIPREVREKAILVAVDYWVNGFPLPRLYAEEVLPQP